MAWCYISLGSNIEPYLHIPWAIERLSQVYGPLLLLPVVKTPAIDMKSTQEFLNSLAVFWCGEPEQLKPTFNTFEEQSGRDRCDPLRSVKDRTLDLDLITVKDALDLQPFYTLTESYCQASLLALDGLHATETIVFPSQKPSQAPVHRLTAGHRPATIDWDHSGRHVLVIEDSMDHLLQRLKTSFHG